MNLLNRYLSAEVFLIHIGHGVLFWVVLVILALSLPWWASLALAPLALFSVAGWAYEGIIVWPVITRLWRGEFLATYRNRAIPDQYEDNDA